MSDHALNPMDTAPKDGKTRVLLVFRKDIYPDLVPTRPDLEGWHGVVAVGRHTGMIEELGRDLGWNIAAPVGHGGLPDRWMAGWLPLPSAAEI